VSRHFIAVLACVVVLASVAAADPVAPTVLGKQGGFGLGIDAGHAERDFELGNRPTVVTGVQFPAGFPPATVTAWSHTTMTHMNANLKTDYVFIKPKFAVHDKIDVYAKLGGTRNELTVRKLYTYSATEFTNGMAVANPALDQSAGGFRDDTDNRPALGLGATAQLFGNDMIKVLADAQYTHYWLGTFEDTYSYQGPLNGNTRIRLSDGQMDTVQISLPVAVTLAKFTIFAGPRYTWARATYDVRTKPTIGALGWRSASTRDELQLKQNEPWGAFAGVAYQITEKIAATLTLGAGDALEGSLSVNIGL